jgi:single-strand DNA-binding protein
MSDVNHVVLIGRLVRDAELRYTNTGKAVSKFSIAVNKKRKVGDQWKDNANFFEIVLWGQIAEALQPYLSKGKQIAIVGEMNQERWEQNGENRSKVTVTASTIQLLGGSSSGSDRGSGQKQETYEASAADEGFSDDIPF